MASTYVNDLRLNEMATGDASGSWGTVTNTNLELIGEAFSYGTETIGDADSTLTIADGAADAARSFYLKITSSVDLTTTRIVTLGPNTVSKVWMIENATTGSQVITIKQGSGATINVPNGQVKMISTDGAGSGGAVLDLLVDVDLTGTTTLVNLDVSGTTLVTGVLTTTAATVSNGGGQFNGTVTVGVDDTGYDVKFFGATTGKSLLWDESADSLIVTGTTTLVGTTNLDAVDIDGATQIDATVTVGVDDTGYDVKFFGATAGAYMLWDESADDLILGGAAGLSVNSAALVTGVLTANGGAVFNESGADVDFRVESNTNANALFVEGSSGNVGIGTTSITQPSAGATTLKIKGTDNDKAGAIFLESANASVLAYIYPENSSGLSINTSTSHPIVFRTAGSERMRIDSVGSVGIGSAPSVWASAVYDALQIGDSLGVGVIVGRTDGVNQVHFGLNWNYDGGATNTYVGSSFATNYSQETGTHRWFSVASGTAGDALTFSESMRITSSGELLVGTTTSRPAEFTHPAGFSVGGAATGQVQSSTDGNTCLFLNRDTSDGTLVEFRKDGTAVGGIGTTGGDLYIATGDTGIRFDDSADQIRASTSAGSNRDGAIDIGFTDSRFKDLYLSGGVYLGGTVAANKLNDYEVGTFNIGFTGASFTIGSTTATYTKVGDTVTWCWFGTADIASASGNGTITGLPFTVRNVDAGYVPMSIAHNDFFGGSATVGQSAYHIKNTTTGAFNNTGTTASATFVNGTGKYLMITGTYFTDS
jgi:hypothetical protein